MFEKLFPAWNLKANRCPAHCLVHKSFWSGHRHCCYGSSPAGSQLSSAAIQLATTHSRLRTRSRTGQKKHLLFTMKSLAPIYPNRSKPAEYWNTGSIHIKDCLLTWTGFMKGKVFNSGFASFSHVTLWQGILRVNWKWPLKKQPPIYVAVNGNKILKIVYSEKS